MVTKQNKDILTCQIGLILAKIHMVTKPKADLLILNAGLILAKIHMVTKQIHIL